MVKRHRAGSDDYRIASDDELDEAFGLNRQDALKDGDLAYVRNKPDGPNHFGTGTPLAKYVAYLDGRGAWMVFGSTWFAPAEDVEIVRRVTVVWT